MAPRRLTIDRVKLALEQNGGIKAAAARMLGCSRTTLYAFLNRHPALQEFLAGVDEEVKDLAEAKLIELIRNGDSSAIRFFLERKGRDRGYSHRVESTGPNGGPMEVKAEVKLDLSTLSDDELQQMIDIQDKLQFAAGKSVEEIVGVNGRHGTVEFSRCDCSKCQRANRLRERFHQ